MAARNKYDIKFFVTSQKIEKFGYMKLSPISICIHFPFESIHATNFEHVYKKTFREYTKSWEVFVPLRRIFTRKRKVYTFYAPSREFRDPFFILRTQKRYTFVIEAQKYFNWHKKKFGCTPPLIWNLQSITPNVID